MLNVFAKRKLEKERLALQEHLTRILPSKDAHWFVSDEVLLAELGKQFPDQITDVRALCCVVKYGISDLMSLPENITSASTNNLVRYIRENSLPEESATWAVGCWARSLDQMSRADRQQIVVSANKLEETRQQVEADREEGRRISRERKHQKEIEDAEKASQREIAKATEVTERLQLIKYWRAAFPSETAAIEKAATSIQQEAIKVATLAGRAEADILIANDYSWGWQERHTFTVYEKGGFSDSESMRLSAEAEAKRKREDANSRKVAIERLIERKIKQDKNASDTRPVVDDEIWHRIKATPDQAALSTKLERAWQAKLQQDKINAEQKRVEDERKRVLQREQQKIEEREAVRQREIAIENERRFQEKEAAQRKTLKINYHRRQFPLRCAGLSDEEVWQQIVPSVATVSTNTIGEETKARKSVDDEIANEVEETVRRIERGFRFQD